MDRLIAFVEEAEALVAAGYYDREGGRTLGPSLRSALHDHLSFPIIAEVKLASPSAGRVSGHSADRLLSYYHSGGAAAVSVLTEPNGFQGSVENLALARQRGFPTLMKDFVVSARQIDCAASFGASAVLLIQEVFDKAEQRRDDLIAHAHRLGLEVLLEAGSEHALGKAQESEADLLGINQRDLSTFEVDRAKASRLLPMVAGKERPVVVLSGIDSPAGVLAARNAGADAVLIGTALSSSPDPARALQDMAVTR